MGAPQEDGVETPPKAATPEVATETTTAAVPVTPEATETKTETAPAQ